jgi:hypothetical protein
MLKVTGKPDEELALTLKGGSPKILFAGALNVIV